MAIQPRSSFTYICDDTEIVISARKTVFAGQIRTAAFGTLVSPKEYLKLLRANWTVPNSSEYEFDFRQTRVSNHCVDVVANMTLLATASARQFTDTLRIFWSPEATPFHISFMSPQRTFTTVQVTSLDQTVIALARLVVPRMGVQGRFLVHLGSRRVAPEDTILTMNAVRSTAIVPGASS